MVKRLLALILALMCILLCACTQEAPPETRVTEPTVVIKETLPPESLKVGVCLPGLDLRWKEQGQLLAAYLEDIGHTALLRYTDQVATQKNQLQELLAIPVDCIVVSAVDAMAMTEILEQAQKQNVPVVALDRMLVNSAAATVCVAVDRFAAGQQMAHYILKNTKPSPEAPRTIEFFMGAPEDHSAMQLYRGVMDVLKPYLESGSLVCKSGRVSFEDTCAQGDLLQMAKEHCLDYLKNTYKKTRPDILCCASDEVAEGCILALEEKAKQVGENYPIITSVGAAPETVKRIVEGKQTMSVYCDPGILAKECTKLVDMLLSGKALPELPKESAGLGETPCLYVAGVNVDVTNFRQVVVEEGSYSLWQVLPEGYVEPEPEPEPTEPAPTETAAPTETTAPAETTAPTETTPAETTAPTQPAPTQTA